MGDLRCSSLWPNDCEDPIGATHAISNFLFRVFETSSDGSVNDVDASSMLTMAAMLFHDDLQPLCSKNAWCDSAVFSSFGDMKDDRSVEGDVGYDGYYGLIAILPVLCLCVTTKLNGSFQIHVDTLVECWTKHFGEVLYSDTPIGGQGCSQ